MRRRLLHISGVVLLVISVALVIWQGSFTFGEWAPTTIEQTYLFWAISTLIFLLMVTLGFMLARTGVKLYIERQANRERSGIKTKMVIGALALSFVPVFFMVLWSVSVLNRNLEKWFSRPAMDVRQNLLEISDALDRETERRGQAVAALLEQALGIGATASLKGACTEYDLSGLWVEQTDGRRTPVCEGRVEELPPKPIEVRRELGESATLILLVNMAADLDARQREIAADMARIDGLTISRKEIRATYLLLLGLITLFILFVATWMALFLAKQINVPIAALLSASDEVRKGNLGHRVEVQAIDELASLVRSFNEMTEALEGNARELENRRRFIEAILNNVPTGVVSVGADGRVQMANRALSRIFPAREVKAAGRVEDLFPEDEAVAITYLMNRARRTGTATRQFDFERNGRPMHVAVTLSALDKQAGSGYVVMIEDTGDLLRAQKAVAWREVARRIAHEIKNPLTPISLCAQRIARQVERAEEDAGPSPEEVARILRECSHTISREVESVRDLVDEFSRFARFPAAKPAPTNLNNVVEDALAVFAGRLDSIEVTTLLADGLPQVNIDPEQFKRVVVNLVDNSAEAMRESALKQLHVATRAVGHYAVELEIADTGCGVSMEDKERLFLPYFSTKGRGTGLGLAIVNQIVSDHGAQVRVEDNYPAGARFFLEIPVWAPAGEPNRAVESRA